MLSIVRRDETNQKKLPSSIRRVVREENEKLEERMIDAINSIDLKKEKDVPCLPSLSTVPHMQRRKRCRAIGLEGGTEKMARMEKNGLEMFQNVVREQKDKADLFVIDDFFWIVCCIERWRENQQLAKWSL